LFYETLFVKNYFAPEWLQSLSRFSSGIQGLRSSYPQFLADARARLSPISNGRKSALLAFGLFFRSEPPPIFVVLSAFWFRIGGEFSDRWVLLFSGLSFLFAVAE